MSKPRFIILYIIKLFKRHTSAFLLTIFFLAVFFLVLQGFKDKIFLSSLTEGLIGTYTEDNLPSPVNNLLSRGLTRVNLSGKAVPDLAESWQVNNDSTVYTFKLKKNLYWVDGVKIKSSDINLSLTDADISNPDDDTIEIKLIDSYSFLPELLDKPVFKKNTHLGTGPFYISSLSKDKGNGIFVNQVVLSTPKADLPSLSINFYNSEEIAKSALKLGKVAMVAGLNKLEPLENQAPFSFVSKPNYSRVVTIFYNSNNSVLSDKNLRLALSFAAPQIEKETVAQTSYSPNSWVFNPNVKDYLNNPEQAKVYLDKVKDNRDKPIVLTTVSSLEPVGRQVVSDWQKNGIKSELRVESGIPQNFQALLIAQDIPLDPDQYSLWHSTQTLTNISHYNSKRADKDLEDGRGKKATDVEGRKAIYQDFQKVLIDDSPATFLYFPKFNVIYQNKIKTDIEKILKIQYPEIFF